MLTNQGRGTILGKLNTNQNEISREAKEGGRPHKGRAVSRTDTATILGELTDKPAEGEHDPEAH